MSEQHDDSPRIVTGVDGSVPSVVALRWAIRQAELTGGRVQGVIAWQLPTLVGGYAWAPAAMLDASDLQEVAAKTLADTVSEVLSSDSSVSVEQLAVEGNPAQVLLDASEGADLLVVGSRGHGGFVGALLGSVSQHCVTHAKCPVAVIRGDTH